MLISGVYYAIRTSAILTSLNVGLCGTDRRFIFVFIHQQFLILGPTLSRCGKLCSTVQCCIVSHSVKVRVLLRFELFCM